MTLISIIFLLTFALAVVIHLGVSYGLWLGWCWAVPLLAPTASHAITHPSFLVFLVVFSVLRAILGR